MRIAGGLLNDELRAAPGPAYAAAGHKSAEVRRLVVRACPKGRQDVQAIILKRRRWQSQRQSPCCRISAQAFLAFGYFVRSYSR